MSDQMPEPPESPDVRTIRQLVRLMDRFDLTAIDLTNEKTTIRLRRRRGELSHVAPAVPTNSNPSSVSVPPPVRPAEPEAAQQKEAVFIRSPMVGTFYESPAPDAQPYLRPGSTVRPDSIVCLIEAMKVFTEINAGVSGTVVEVLVKNGQPVEFDQPLFRVEPA